MRLPPKWKRYLAAGFLGVLLAAGLSKGDVAKIMGGNVRDFLSRTLPVK